MPTASRRLLHLIVLVTLPTLTIGCSEWVGNVDPPIDSVPSEQQNNPDRLNFLTTGVQGLFAETHDQLTVLAGGLSDEQVFDRDLPQATFPSFDRLERGDMNIDDGTINEELGELRFHADDLIDRLEEMEIGSEHEEDAQSAKFWGYFAGGVARAWYASYMGLESGQGGGGVIDDSPFIPSEEMYMRALGKLDSAKGPATSYQERVVNSTMARQRLYRGDYQEALDLAQQGLKPGDDPFESLHNSQSVNEWYNAAGIGRTQWRVNTRYAEHIQENPGEEERIELDEIEGRTQVWNRQGFYTTRDATITFIDWQETYLMLAELGLRTGDSSVVPLDLVNQVRESHGLSPLSSVDMDMIIEERDKELMTRGQRLVDQRRFNIWHLDSNEEQIGAWRYFPISEAERNNNPNL